jgi:hypothetical protein
MQTETQTPEQIRARRRAVINMHADGIFVQVDGKATKLNTLKPAEREQAIERLVSVPNLIAPDEVATAPTPAPKKPWEPPTLKPLTPLNQLQLAAVQAIPATPLIQIAEHRATTLDSRPLDPVKRNRRKRQGNRK